MQHREYEKALTARDALVLSVPEAGFGNERAAVAIENLAKVGWRLVPCHQSPGPSGYSPDEFRAECGGLADHLKEVNEARAQCDAALADVERFKNALMPSADTKADYLGEFKFPTKHADKYVEDKELWVYVPWITIKEIMARIFAHASFPPKREGKGPLAASGNG